MNLFIDLTVIAILIAGIWQFREPHRAKYGNLTAAFALFLAFILVLYRNGIVDVGTVALSLLAGAAAGYALARAVNMIQVPAMVAFQHGCGGVAAFLVALVELSRTTIDLSLVSEISGVLGLAIGSLTFSGSMIASAKLANKMRQAPQVLDKHNLYVIINLALIVVVGALSLMVPHGFALVLFVVEILLGACFGILVAMRIGGADMPVLISSLNATAGVAASLCGMIIENQLLIAFGATVAASGSILTYVMCKAMNRKLRNVVFPQYKPTKSGQQTPAKDSAAPIPKPVEKPAAPIVENDQAAATRALKEAKRIIIVPGYGMALAKAGTEVAALANELMAMGKDVKYAIHPVAGRMPGHMNVLLAEAGVDYDMLVEMEAINPEFHATDLVLVVGSCDVVNPAAIKVEGTPISGMPILKAHEAKKVICCNFDRKPGYSGVENSLYDQDNCIMLEGDAKKTVQGLLSSLTSEPETGVDKPLSDDGYARADKALRTAKRVIIVPGYGMALAKAGTEVATLADELIAMGKDVKYAIHPVAGRMPGHMNVLLAEAGVEYDMLVEMEAINSEFHATDLVLVVGSCDVVNPAAIKVEGTPISGMPILKAHEAKQVICCNFDRKPGYSGVENSLYDQDNCIMLEGDAKKTVQGLLNSLTNEPASDASAGKPAAGDGYARADNALRSAKSIIIVPGYGMALAKAGTDVATLADELITMGKDVKYAIHPVAGRMPGHMNVLLAEAGVDYDMLVEMEAINPEFHTTDLVLVVGSCDVVNPAAIKVEGTPISGMPILKAHEAKQVICCNFDRKPGYSGVENSLYDQDNCIMLEGDAKKTIQELQKTLVSKTTADAPDASANRVAVDTISEAVGVLATAKSVVIIPGYGMALAKAQFKLVEMVCLLEQRGVSVKYAIHPVAGRMPGHMNVLLAEAEVEYEDLLEMDDVNPLFRETDVAIVVGACDVVNPAAIESEGTPISGMPILLAQDAKRIIVCNFDTNPGYSGVPNPLYNNSKTIMLTGDAKETISNLHAALLNIDV